MVRKIYFITSEEVNISGAPEINFTLRSKEVEEGKNMKIVTAELLLHYQDDKYFQFLPSLEYILKQKE